MQRRLVLVLVLVLLAALAPGAGCEPRIPASYPGPPEIVLGQGYERFTPIADGDAVPIVMGIQGGYHIWGAVRARYVDPRQLRLEFTLTVDGAAMPASIRYDHVDLEGTRDGLSFGEHRGSAIFLPLVDEVRDRPSRLRLEVIDMAGRRVATERRIRPQ